MTDTTAPVPPTPEPAPETPTAETSAAEMTAAEASVAGTPAPGDAWGRAPELLESAGAGRRRSRATLLRWGAAALVLLLSGTGAALAVAAPDRTDIPGLATPNDGRYAFPPLTLPPLPSGKPAPDDAASYGRHFADLRGLLLPLPEGAVPERPATGVPAPAAPASGTPASSAPSAGAPSAGAAGGVSFVACADYTAGNAAKARLDAGMTEFACRTATRRTWTAADGTRTDIWLFRFGSRGEASGMLAELGSSQPAGVSELGFSDVEVDPSLGVATLSVRASEEKAKGQPTARAAFLAQGDVAVSIVMTNPAGVPLQAYRQVTLLQSQMLR
ncbi:hypothetical protein AB0442_15655 [Kitasatospora sp. NPDC085895]|uniref:hypothetical protein n=1 Tax=Kitasatospora sp. NPDC085895 TaxID=3155057 RepID=UPI00344C3AAD